MIPVCDVIPSRTTPWVTMGLIAANAIIFGYEWSLSATALADLFREVAFVGLEPSLASAAASLFLHENGWHLALNLMALWIFGDNVEDQLGHGRFLVAYVAAGVVSCYAAAWMAPAPFVPLVGSSGAVAGVIGAYFVMFPRSRVLFLTPTRSIVDAVELPAAIVAGAWFAPQVAGGLGPLMEPWSGAGAMALWPIAGGFAAGILTGTLARRPERQRVEWWGS